MVTRATIRTSTWDVMYNHLQTGTYAISTNNIFSAWNSNLANDKGYPLVILMPPSTSFEKATLTGEITESEVVYNIEVYHTNAQNLKALADEITNSLITGRTVFSGNRLMNMEISGDDYETWAEGSKKIHRVAFNVTYRYVA